MAMAHDGTDSRRPADARARAPLRHQAADPARAKLTPRPGRSRRSEKGAPHDPRDRWLVVGLVAVLALGSVPALLPSPFAPAAPITIAASEPLTAPIPAPVETAALPASTGQVADALPATDPAATGAIRTGLDEADPEATTATEPELAPNATVIEVPRAAPSLGPIRVSDPSDMRQAVEVAHLPDRALLDGDGLPVVASGKRPLDVYAGRWSGRRGNRIAVVVGGLGLSQSGTQAAIEALPAGVTLALSADGNSLERWMRVARREGHELLMQVPMQPFGLGTPDPRERRLELGLGAAENVGRLLRSLSRTTNYVGVMNYRGGAFQADEGALDPVMRAVRDRGLLYVDDGSNAQSQAGPLARRLAAPFAGADAVIDLDRDPEAIANALARLEETARGTGRAIAVASAYPESVKAIAEWSRSVGSRGFELVPVSALASDPGGR